MSTGTCFPNTIHSFSPLFFPLKSGWERNQQQSGTRLFRSSAPLEQASGQFKLQKTLRLLAAAEIIPVFNPLVTHQPPHAPHRLSFPAVPLHLSTHSSCPPPHPPHPPPLRPHGFQDNERVVLNIKIEIQTDGTRTGGQNQVLKEWERNTKRMKIPPPPTPSSLYNTRWRECTDQRH